MGWLSVLFGAVVWLGLSLVIAVLVGSSIAIGSGSARPAEAPGASDGAPEDRQPARARQ